MEGVVLVSLGPPTKVKVSSSERMNTVPETIAVYDFNSGIKLFSHRLEGACSGVACNSKSIISSRLNKATFAIFSWGKEAPASRFAAPEVIGPVSLTHDGVNVVAGGESGTLYIWEVHTGQLLCAWKAHYRKILCLQFSDDDSVLITGGDDAMVNIWDFSSAIMNESYPEKSLIRTISSNKTGVTGVTCGVGGINSKIATCSLDHTCRVFQNGTEIFCGTYSSSLLSISLDFYESLVFTGALNGNIYFGEIKSGKTTVIQAHEGAITTLRSTFVKYPVLLSGSDDGTLKWWDIQSRSTIRTIRVDGATPVREIFFLDINFQNVSSKKRIEQVPMKKLKETNTEERCVMAVAISESEQNADVITGLSGTKSHIGYDDVEEESRKSSGEEAKWVTIANRLYAIAVENTIKNTFSTGD